MKKELTVYLDEKDYEKLKEKAEELFSSRGAIPNYIRKICNEPIVFMDKNLLSAFKALTII